VNVRIEDEAYNQWWEKEGRYLSPHGAEGYYLAFAVAFEAGRKVGEHLDILHGDESP